MGILLSSLLGQSKANRFKLLGIVGKNETKRNSIINVLINAGWTLIDVETELIELKGNHDSDKTISETEINTLLKNWFNAKPDEVILINANILYSDIFCKTSALGAFKYKSRDKHAVIFLEDEKLLGDRISYGNVGDPEYHDRSVSDMVIIPIEDIEEDYTLKDEKRVEVNKSELKPNAIGHLFDLKYVKDVIDIDTDLQEKDKQKNIISSYIITEVLERQIFEFFEDLEKPTHKARTVIGNYGSGKSHLVAFLVSLVQHPELADSIANSIIKQKVGLFARRFLTVQFELGSQRASLQRWFYDKVRKQLGVKYDIDIPEYDPDIHYDDKVFLDEILRLIKENDPKVGLLVVVDEISDFLSSKQKEEMKADMQFLRIIGQFCQDQDLMFVGSMQEDVFSSPKFKDVAAEMGRIGERFQNIIIHKEDIKKVLSQRIVPKSGQQKHQLEEKLKPFAEKIEDVSRNIDTYVNLFPFTSFMIELFHDMPYFELRGIIQFAMSELKYLLNEDFPYFITFEKIYDQLESNPNKRNLEEIFEVTKAMKVLDQKVKLIETKYQGDAKKVVKGLAVYSLWNKREKGATSEELANNLMLLPDNKLLSAKDHVELIIKKVRDVTEGEYIKVNRDPVTDKQFFYFDTIAGIDPEQKISQKAAAVSNDELENELFIQLRELLELDRVEGQYDVFEDECEWQSRKTFRKGIVIFIKDGHKQLKMDEKDYTVLFISPFYKGSKTKYSRNQLNITIQLKGEENVEILKEICAIKGLINSNIQKQVMNKKLDQRINGYRKGATNVTGFKYRLSKLLTHHAECDLNGKTISIKKLVDEQASVLDIFETLKLSTFEEKFSESFPLHPTYSIQLSSKNIQNSLTSIVGDITQGNFTNLSRNTLNFMHSLDLLDTSGYPSISKSKIANWILDKIKENKNQVTNITEKLIDPLTKSDYGLEKEITQFFLVILTTLGKTYLQAKGGEKIDINSVRERLRSLHVFETIAYARIQEDYSYDFAAGLLNALGLNGAKIQSEKDRLAAFREYREKIQCIIDSIEQLDRTMQELGQKPQLFLDKDRIQNELSEIKEIKWNELQIDNPMQFSKIEHFEDQKSRITIALDLITKLQEALKDYEDFHNSIIYMDNALEALDKNDILVTNLDKLQALKDYLKDVKSITDNYELFIDKSQRNPIKGKIQQFKSIYAYDFYVPAHDRYVGKKLNWQNLDSYHENETFKKLALLNKLTCLSNVKFNQMVTDWEELQGLRCSNNTLEENLKSSVKCQRCSFPDVRDFLTLPSKLDDIEEDIETLYAAQEIIVLREIRTYENNVQFLDSEDEKELINDIRRDQKLWDYISQDNIRTINKLFKEIDVVEVDRDEIIDTLFPNQEMVQMEEIRKRFYDLEAMWKKNKQESEIRLKLK